MRRAIHDVVVVAGVALVVSSCASTTAGVMGGGLAATLASTASQTLPAGAAGPALNGNISPAEAVLRSAVAAGDSGQALRAVGALPKDELVRLLHIGLIYHRAGAFAASNQALQAAERMAEDRYTKSVTQQLGAAVINETVAEYVPPAHERAFIHYYGMMNYLRLGNLDDALVEARKANMFLERYARENGGRTFTLDAAVEYVAGMMHLAGGDNNDAMVSLQKSMKAFDTYSQRYGVPRPRLVGVDATRVATRMGSADIARDIGDRFELSASEGRTPAGTGELLVLIENGFIAHKVQQKLYVSLTGGEVNSITSGGLAGFLLVGIPVIDRIITLFKESNNGNEYAQAYSDGYMIGAMLTGGENFTMAWPKYALDAHAVEDVTVNIGTQRQGAIVMDDLSAIAARSFEEDKTRIMRRSLFRAAGKWAIAKYGEKKAEAAAGGGFSLKGIAAGAGARMIGQGLASASEVADTRSWSTLPAEVRVARFSLPPGDHKISLTVLDGDGATRTVELGNVAVNAGKIAVRTAFVTGNSKGAMARFEKARAGTDVAATGIAVGVPIAAPTVAPTSAPAGTSRASIPLPATLASVSGVKPLSLGFKPLNGETVSFAIQMRGTPEKEQRARAELAAYVVKQGTTDTALVWNGGEGDTLTWGGRLGNTLAARGAYTWILRTTTPRGDRPTLFSWTTLVDIDAPNGSSLASEPAAPELESETKTIREPNWQKKSSLKKRGIIWGALGSLFTTTGYIMATKAVTSTPPQSTERSTALAVWGSGAAIVGIGSLMFTSGMLGSHAHDVQVPDPGAKVRNDDAKAAHAAKLGTVRSTNERVKTTTVMRVRPSAATQGRP